VLVAALWHHYISRGALAEEIRRTVVTQLQDSLGREVQLSSVRLDWPRGVTLSALRVAERGGFAHGTAFSVDEVRLLFEWWRLVSIPPDIVGSLTEATLRRPHLALTRDAAGAWSVSDLLSARGVSGPSRFRGRLILVDGSLMFSDAFDLPPPPFRAAYGGIEGAADFRRGDEIDLNVWGRSTRQSRPGVVGYDAESLRVTGRYRPKEGTSELDIAVTNASARRWGRYLVRVQELDWEAGRFGGAMHLSLAPSSTGVALEFSAKLTLHDADLVYRPERLALRHASGPITVDSRHVETPGLALRANGSPLVLDGSMVFDGGPWIQIGLVSPNLDLATVQALFFPKAALTLAGTTGAHLQVVGPVQALDIAGEMTGAQGRLNGQAFSGLHTRLQYAAGTLALTGLRASVGGGSVTGDVVLDVENTAPGYLFNGTARGVDVGALASAGISGLSQVRGRVSGRVVGVGSGARAQVLGDVTLGVGSVRGLAFHDAHAIFWRGDDGRIDLDFLRGQIGDSTVFSAGQIGADGTIDLDVVGHNFSLAAIARQAGVTGQVPLALDGRIDLVGRATGTTEAPQVSGRVSASHGRVGPIAFTRAEGTLTISPKGLTTSGLTLVNGTALYRMSGALGFRPLSAAGLRVEVENAEAQWLTGALSLAPDLSGTINGSLTIDGPLSAPSIAGRVELDRGTVQGRRIDHAEVRFAPDPGRIRIAVAEARVNGSRLVASGTIDPAGPLNLSLSATNMRLADIDAALGLGLPVDGTFALSGEVRGTFRNPVVSGQISAPRVAVGPETFSASGALEYEAGVLRLSELQLAQGTSRYRLSGEIRAGPRPSAGLVLEVDHGQLASVLSAAGLKLPAPLAGTVDGRIELAGPLDDPSARVSLSLRDATFGAYAIGAGVADVTLTHQTIDIDRFEIHPAQGQVAAKGRVDLRGNNSVEVSAQNLNPDFLRPFFQLDRPLEGRLNFVLQFSGPTRDPKAGVSLEAFDAGISGVQADRIAALAFYSAGTLTIEQGLISKGPHKVVALGTIPVDPTALVVDPRAPLQLQFRLQDADLSFLSLVAPTIKDTSGTVQGEVKVGGTVEAPRMTGFLRSSGGRFRDAAINTPIEDLDVDVAFTQDTIQVRNISATLGRGRAALNGSVSITNLRPGRLQLSLRADAVTIDIPDLYNGALTADLKLEGPAGQPTLSGRATLQDGLISPAGTIGQAGGPGGPGGLGVLPPGLKLDVSVDAGQNTTFTLGAIRAQVEGSVHVGGTLAHPTMSGRVTSPEGEVAFLGTTFRLTGGEAVFSESLGIEPQISARAQQVYGDTIVFLDVNGPATHPELTLTANPPLPQEEIVTLVARQAGILGDPQAVLGQGLGRFLLGSLREALHLNEFTISYGRESPVTLRLGKFVMQNLYLTLSQVWPGPASPTSVPFGTFPRTLPTTQSYAVAGIEYFLSPNVLATFNVDTLGGTGIFVLTRFPF
jgi:translocation and assembly module TamB